MAAKLPTSASYPADLTSRRQWLVWRYVLKPGQKKPSKMPYYATTGHLRGWPMGKPRDGQETPDQPQVDQGHAIDREHLVDFDTALAFAQSRRFDGVGFAFLPGDGLVGIDLDGVIGGSDERAALGLGIRNACETFAEVSPSGTGLHIIGLGECETFKSNDVGIEVFCGRQFFTMPGLHDDATPMELREIPADVLAHLRALVDEAKEAARLAKHPPAPAQATPATPRPRSAADTEAMRYCLHALQSAVERVSGCAEGGRNDTLNQEAYGLGQLLHHGVITETGAAAELAAAAKACGLPPGEAAATIRSGLRSGQKSPRPIPARTYSPQPPHPVAGAGRRSSPPPAEAPPHIDPDTGEILDIPGDAPPQAADNDNDPQQGVAGVASEFGTPIDVFGVQPPPEMPMDVLPQALVPYVQDQAALLGCDPAVIALGALVSAAACITDGIRLQPKRHDPTWTESARIWGAVVGDPSTKKTPALGKAVRHVKRINHRMTEENSSALADYQWQHDSWKEAKKADKQNPPPEPKAPPLKRLMVEDVTVEKLADILKDNPRGVLNLRDELTGWFAAMDAYKGSSKGASLDRAHWLETYNGGARSIDRVVRGSVFVPNWSCCVLGGIQPDMIRRVAANMGNDGLLQRFIVLMARPAGDDVDRVPDMQAMEDYSRLFDQLVALQSTETPVTLTEAAHQSREHIARAARRMAAAFDQPHLTAWLGKWEGLQARLLLLYHVIDCATHGEYPTVRQVDAEIADQVERLMMNVLLPHALHFYADILDANDRQEHIRQLARLILAKGWTKITRRDITQSWKASRKLEAYDLRAVIDSLCVQDWLLPDETDIGSDNKPRSWWVNMAVHDLFADQAGREKERRLQAASIIRQVRQSQDYGT